MRTSLLAALLAALLLAGCGGGKASAPPNGAASDRAAKVLRDAKQAASKATSVHIEGDITSHGRPVSLDLTIERGTGGKGSLSVGGLSFDLVVLGGKAYIKGSDAFYRHFAGSTAETLLHGRWVEGSATTGRLAQLTQFANIDALYALVAAHGKLENQGETRYKGQQAVAIHDSAQGGTLYVAATGPPYPIAVVGTGTTTGTITFGDWNADVSISAPKGALDLSTFGLG